jgi:hypothetical protein
MSLKQFIALKDVKDRLKPFRPPPPRKIGVPIKVESRGTKDGSPIVGQAFDYLIRFELQRRATHLVGDDRRWVAEIVPSRIQPGQTKTQIEATLSEARRA